MFEVKYMILICTTTILALVSILYWYYKRYYNFWNAKGVSGPAPLPLIGNYLRYLVEGNLNVELNWFRRYGKLYGVYFGNVPVLKVADPELIKLILVKDFHCFTDKSPKFNRHPIADKGMNVLTGEDWKRVRSLLTPTFTSRKLRKIYPTVIQCLNKFMITLEEKTKTNGTKIDIKKNLARYLLDAIFKTSFSVDTDVYDNNALNENIFKAVAIDDKQIILNLLAPNFILKYFRVTNGVGPQNSRDYMYKFIGNLINERKNSKHTYNDFLELAMNAEKDEIETVGNENNGSASGVSNYITENEIIASAHGFIVTGFGPTSSVIAHSIQELALNLEIQETLYSEIKSLVDSSGEIDLDDLFKLPYLDAVISETLRLHTHSVNIKRMATQDYKLGDTGITLKKGQKIEIPAMAMHRSNEFYPDAQCFIPDRFLSANKDKLIPYTYLPFGTGPRNCIGMRYATNICKITLFYLIKNFKISKSIDTDIPVKLSRSIFFHAPQRVLVNLVKRKI